MLLSLKIIAQAQQRRGNSGAFNFPSESSVAIAAMAIPNSDQSVLVDTNTNRILILLNLELPVISHCQFSSKCNISLPIFLNPLGIKVTCKFIQARFLFKNMHTKICDFVQARVP